MSPNSSVQRVMGLGSRGSWVNCLIGHRGQVVIADDPLSGASSVNERSWIDPDFRKRFLTKRFVSARFVLSFWDQKIVLVT